MFPNIFCPAEPQITDGDLDRPAKDLPLETTASPMTFICQNTDPGKAIYQLGLKLHDRHATCGDWANLAELLGYGRDKIDEFENQSAAERRSASFLMLKDWTKQVTGRSLYVLRESLRRCGREDCILYLDQKVVELSSMQLHIKLIDETFADPNSRFMTITTRCDASLRESLENLLGGNVNDFEIDASWNDKASNFKGRHLSIRRSKRPNIVYCESDSSSGEGAIDKMPYNDLSGNRINNNMAPLQSSDVYGVQQETLTRKKVYLSDECLYCGKFRTITRTRPNPGEPWQDSGGFCSSCQCESVNNNMVARSRDVNMDSDEELVTSSTDSQPHALRYFETTGSLSRTYRGPGNTIQTLVQLPVDQNVIRGNMSNQQQSYTYMTSTLVQQPTNYVPRGSHVQNVTMMAANQNFSSQGQQSTITGSQQTNIQLVEMTDRLTNQNNTIPVSTSQQRERANSEPVPFTGLAQLQSPMEFGGGTSTGVLKQDSHIHNTSKDSLRDTIGDIFSDSLEDVNGVHKDDPPKLPPRTHLKYAPYPSQTVIAQRKVQTDVIYTFPGEAQFHLFCAMLRDVPGWWPRETEATIEDSMGFVCKEDGHYMMWYMRSKNTLVLSVSHLGKIIHYAFYSSVDANGQTWYYIFPSKRFTNLKDLINHHIVNGLDPQAQQEVPENGDAGGFISQQNMRQSRRLVRMLHVRLRYPIVKMNTPRPRQSV